MTLLHHQPALFPSTSRLVAPISAPVPKPNPARIAVLLLAIGILNAVDLAYTLFAYRMGWLTEINPLARAFLSLGFAPTLICYKILTVIAGSLMLWKLRAHRWAAPACWLVLLSYAALAIWWYLWAADLLRLYDTHRAL